MRPFHVTILGCSSATPTVDRHPSAQIVNVNEKLLLIDCGEGTQIQLLKNHIRFLRIHHIYISHLHGDHILGLPGLLSTMSLNGRKELLNLYGPPPLEDFLKHFLTVSGTTLLFQIKFHALPSDEVTLITDEKDFSVTSFPLKHRIACTGFMVTEKYFGRKINKSKVEEWEIPMEFIGALKNGENIIWKDQLYLNESLTFTQPNPKKYFYCSDTAYMPELCELFFEADLLYHEATFLDQMGARAAETFHSTALQAATLAKESQVKKLLLGHYSARYKDLTPLLEEARSVFPNSHLALEGETYFCS